jgi:hypothetical protein
MEPNLAQLVAEAGGSLVPPNSSSRALLLSQAEWLSHCRSITKQTNSCDCCLAQSRQTVKQFSSEDQCLSS